MALGWHGLAAATMTAVLTAWLPAAAKAQTAPAPATSSTTTTTKPAAGTTTTKPATGTTATKPATTTKPATGTTATKPAAGTTATKPATTTKPAAGTTATKPATTTGTAQTKPATPKAPAPPAKSTAAAPAKGTSAPAAQAQPAPSGGAPAPKPAAPAPATPKPAPPQQATPLREATPTASALPGAPAPALQTSFRQRHPLIGGFLTGLVGVGLADALLGADVPPDAAGAPAGTGGNVLEPVEAGLPTAEFLGQVMRLAFFAGLIALAVLYYRRRLASAAPPAAGRRRSAPELSGWDGVDEPAAEPEPVALTRPDEVAAIADEQDFADILLVVQAAWSEGDVMAMRSHITPDMATYFDRRLAQNAENGIENRVVDVSAVRVERLSDWEDEGLQYARARMRWRALDYVIDMSKLPDEPGYIIDGSIEDPIDCEEVWTFVKSPDGAWVLCEVEQDG
jgi:predicted lipid-binding transport protein (Tim44 family)